MNTRALLLVEDSPGDVRLTQEAFRHANSEVVIHVAEDGIDAMSFLRRDGVNGTAPRPDLILVDLNLPRMDGREVLAFIKSDADLKTIPTVVLITSTAASDVTESYRQQANCYLAKPAQPADFETLVCSINDFWIMKVRLPRRSEDECR